MRLGGTATVIWIEHDSLLPSVEAWRTSGRVAADDAHVSVSMLAPQIFLPNDPGSWHHGDRPSCALCRLESLAA
jgi:hypothetical protein